MIRSGLPKAYWSYAIGHLVYLINRLHSIVINYKASYKLIYKSSPTYLNLKTFGSVCFASTLDSNRTKLEPKARKCIFLCYKNGIKVLDTNNIEIFINRNVIFSKKIFPYKMAHNYAFDNQE